MKKLIRFACDKDDNASDDDGYYRYWCCSYCCHCSYYWGFASVLYEADANDMLGTHVARA